jgi:hypothetical protein
MTEEIKKTKAVALVESNEVNTFITEAISKGLPVETMQKLFELRKEVKTEQAREEFMRAMANFQRDCPVITKTKGVKSKAGAEIYKYADLGSIVEQVKKPLADNELSYDFITEDTGTFLNVTCTVTHALGHSKTSSFKIPIGTEAFMTDVQKYGARVTFAKRYAFCNALGILTGDEDTDAKDDSKKKDSLVVNVKANITASLKKLGEKVNSKENIQEAIARLTKLDPNGDEKTLNEIYSRLQVLISEKNESN